MGKFGAYETYSDLLNDEARLGALREKHDALTPKETEEKLRLFRSLSTTGRVYTDITITNTTMPHERLEHEEETADQRRAAVRFGELRKRQFDLTAKEQTELRRLYRRFGDQPERYTRTGVTLHVGG
jgi:hypothetical protein